MKSKLVKFFLSRRVAVGLLLLMLPLLFFSTRSPELQITSSVYFLIIPSFIFLSVLLCTIDRLKTFRNKTIGFWGSMLFHAGLLTVMIAAILTQLTLFYGELLLTEGFPTSLDRDGFVKIWNDPIGNFELPDGMITLESFKSVYENNFPVDHEANLYIKTEEDAYNKIVKVNDPLVIDGLQYSLNRYGFAPAFIVKDYNGETLIDAFINLVVVEGSEDNFDIPGKMSKAYIRFYPDFVMTEKGPTSKSRLPNNPVMAVKIKSAMGESKYMLLKKGQAGEIMGMNVSFSDLSYWASFQVNKDLGMPVFFAAFIMIIAGLSMRFLTMKPIT